MKTYKCPLCGSKLPKERYKAALHIQEEKEKAQAANVNKLLGRLRQEKQAKVSLKVQLKKSQQAVKSAGVLGERRGALVEKRRQERLTLGLKNKLQLAQARIQQLQRGTTPQTEGLEFESNLWKRLVREFPEDKIEHKGKGGDILHTVIFRKEVAGIIIYECKQSPKILPDHVKQAALAKKTREAHFAILVTTGSRKGFTGLAKEDNVLIVAPLGVIPLAHLCRAHLIEMAKAKLDNEKKNQVATRMLNFITSPTYRVPLEETIQQSDRARKLLNKEAKQHFVTWQERYEIYQTIKWDIAGIQSNLSRVLSGEKPFALERPKIDRLQLPAISEN